MIRAICLCISLMIMLFSCSQVKQVSRTRDQPNAIPIVRILNDNSALPIKISALGIDINIAANIAVTTFDITFSNPNNRVLEGELEFPLADGQHVIRYALDIDGKLREGVVVEKAKARVAFENTIRRKIDPGLVEKTKGNNFRTRVYPLPANGTRHIIIAIEQTLEFFNKDLVYQLPLETSEAIDKFNIQASVVKNSVKPRSEETGLASFSFNKKQSGWFAEYSQNNFIANNTVRIVLPVSEETSTVLVENHNETSYFYLNAYITPGHKMKASPKTVGIFWDISASAEKRDLKKEKLLLKEWLSQPGNAKISLIPFNITTQTAIQFDSGNSNALLKEIDGLVYDGGTQLGIIDCHTFQFDEILLFSDGLSTFGKKEMGLSGTPVTTISSSASADFSYLKYIAQQTHGKFIDLSKLELKNSIDELSSRSFEIIRADFNAAEIEDLVLPIGPIQNSGLSFAGKLKGSSATIKLHLGFGNDITETKTFTITKPEQSDHDNVKRIWAELKIDNLDLQFEKNKEEITKLGKQFSIVTQNTSLIVLDRVEDYVEHEIIPPQELQKEYYTLLKEKLKVKKNDTATALNEALDAMKQLKEWWQKNYSPARKIKDSLITDTTYITSTDSSRIRHYSVANSTPNVQELRFDSTNVGGAYSIASGDVQALELGATVLNFTTVDRDGIGETLDEKAYKNEEEEKPADIEVNKWKADASYLKDIENVDTKDRKSKYYSLRKQRLSQPSFFIDIARFFIEKNEKQFALLVLSNVAEMKLEDAELLRMMANELIEAKEQELAIETFRDILKMREEHPQSYRDLALALSESGKNNEAVELLYKVITRSWDMRFTGVKSIALNEMNAIISANNSSIDISSIDQRLVYPMPVDIRIVINWNTDNSDIDLWVTDPRNEKCTYEHTETAIGGKISQDITGGFGPEEFSLKKAWKGNYIVEANLYGETRQTLGGPITIRAELFTDFGKPTQKRKTINFRVTTNKEVVKIGSLKI